MKICNNAYTSTFVNQRIQILERELAMERAAEYAMAGAHSDKVAVTPLNYVIVGLLGGAPATIASYTENGVDMAPIIGWYKPFLTTAEYAEEEATKRAYVAMRYIDLLFRVVKALKSAVASMPKCPCETEAPPNPTTASTGPSFESFWDAVLRNNAPQRRN